MIPFEMLLMTFAAPLGASKSSYSLVDYFIGDWVEALKRKMLDAAQGKMSEDEAEELMVNLTKRIYQKLDLICAGHPCN